MRSKQDSGRLTIPRRKRRAARIGSASHPRPEKAQPMPIGPLPKITVATASELFPRYEPEESSLECRRDGMTPVEYLEALSESEQWTEAIKFLTQALPKPEAISWASHCVRNGSVVDLAPAALAALEATEQWLANPTDDRRRAAHAAAEAAGLGTPAGCVALSVFFSGGSLGPKTLEHPIPPADDLTGKALAGALLLAAVIKEPENAPAKLQNFVEQGLEFARGRTESQ